MGGWYDVGVGFSSLEIIENVGVAAGGIGVTVAVGVGGSGVVAGGSGVVGVGLAGGTVD